MSDHSAIEWTEATLNPWTGCTKVSPGCAHCYIPRTMPFRTAGRDFDGKGHIPLVFHMKRLERMVRRRKPTMYFVNSLSDLFHEEATDEQIARVFAAMASAPQHTFQVLTKRPERMQPLLSDDAFVLDVAHLVTADTLLPIEWPLPNAWMGVSIENRRFVHRADLLRETPAAVRFISAEPLLGPLVPRPGIAPPANWPDFERQDSFVRGGAYSPGLDLTGIDWCIIGGESGQGYRPMRLEWARDLLAACYAAGTAPFVKQLGGARPGNRLEDLPEDLRVRDFPRAPERVA